MAKQAARLKVLAQLRPPTAQTAEITNTMQADLSADIAPWLPQPLLQASAEVRALNLAALWPQAPVTALEGSVQAGPKDS